MARRDSSGTASALTCGRPSEVARMAYPSALLSCSTTGRSEFFAAQPRGCPADCATIWVHFSFSRGLIDGNDTAAGGVYVGGIARSDRHHRHPDRIVVAGRAGGPRGGTALAVREQSQAVRPGHEQLRERPQAV